MTPAIAERLDLVRMTRTTRTNLTTALLSGNMDRADALNRQLRDCYLMIAEWHRENPDEETDGFPVR